MASLLIQGGRIVTADADFVGDIYIVGETIAAVGTDLAKTYKADKVINAAGKICFPGGIDPHTHFDMPFGGTTSADDFESGTIAAAFGGTTTVIDFAIQATGESTMHGLDTWHKKADGKATIDYAFHMIVTDMPDERLPEMERLAGEGVTSYKLFMAYPGVLYVDDATLYRAFRQAGENGTRICMHAENGIVIDEIIKGAIKDGKTAPIYHALTRPTRMEAEGVHRSIAIAEVANVPLYIVHLSSHDALEEVKRARARGVDVSAETCPQYLLLDQSYYEKPNFEGAKYVMTPALREKHNQDHLWQGLKFNDLSSVATDHCPFCFKHQKELGKDDFRKIPNGAPGVENRFALIYHHGVSAGRISLQRFVEITSTNAAKTFGLWPKKGTIAPGSDGDVVVFDPKLKQRISIDNKRTHHMKVDYNTFEGFEVEGYPEIVVSRGRVVVDGNNLTTTGGGRFIKRARQGQLLR